MSDDLTREIIAWLEGGRELLQEQAPEVAAEIVTWGVVLHSIGFVVGLCLMLAFGLWTRRVYKSDGDIDRDAGLLILGGLTLGGLLVAWVNLYWLLTAWLAPRLFILEVIKP